MSDHDPLGHELARRLTDSVDSATPPVPPPYDGVSARRAARRRRRRGTAGVLVAATAVGGVALAGVLAGGTHEAQPAGGTEPPAASNEPGPAPVDVEPRVYEQPPDFTLLAGTTRVPATAGSSCWGNRCADMVSVPFDALPDVGEQPVLEAEFPLPAQWYVDTSERGGGCGTYPVLVAPTTTGIRLTPTGPAGERRGYVGIQTDQGQTSGEWRWTVPERDGVPSSWLRLVQNTPNSGGGATMSLILDDAAVDGDVSARVSVLAPSDQRTGVDLERVDQQCEGDGFVELGLPFGTPQRRLDAIGPQGYVVEVALTIDGTDYHASAPLSTEGTLGGGDVLLDFDPPLPRLDD
ncbi:hypothetical protein BH09ACT12_BH09ACT12_02090 [soil metagenome]